MDRCSGDALLRLFAVKLWNNGEKVKWLDNEVDWYRAMVKKIWRNGAENKHPCSYGEMVIWWNWLLQSYGETSIVKCFTEYIPMLTWWNVDLVKWCGANNTKVKWCNGENIILTFYGRWFLGPLQRLGPIPLLHFVGCCITCWWKNCLWMMPRWFSRHPISRCNSLWCRIPPVFSDWFLLFILLLIRPTTANTVTPFFTFLYLAIDICTCIGDI